MEIVKLFVVGLIPLVVGFVWYNPSVLGKVWQKAARMSDEDVQSGNMAVIFGIAYLLAVVLAVPIKFVCGLHTDAAEINFVHGAFHGAVMAVLIGLPMLITNSLFERKGLVYTLINGGYWIVSAALMGGVLMIW